jgi:UDP-3-O-[3-hydroxymyristoyl] glucosamine N-acyltransferase
MKLRDIASLLGGRIEGDPEAEIRDAAGLEDARPGDITFAAKASFVDKALASGASCVILEKADPRLATSGKSQLVVDDPQMAFVRLLEKFHPARAPAFRGASRLAFVCEGARVAEDATVHAFAHIAEGATVGKRTVIHPGVFVGEGSIIGEDCVIHPNVTVREGVTMGNRVIVQAGAVIGADGFGYIFREGRHVKVPQVGGVIIEDDVEIGACTTIDRATTGNTVVGAGTKIDNLVQIAHNVKIGRGCVIVSQVGIAGSTVIGNYVTLAGQAAVADHARLADGVILAARGAVMPGAELKKGAYGGAPAAPHRQWLRTAAVYERLPEIHKALMELEIRLSELERRVADDGRE